MSVFKPGDIVVSKENQICKSTGKSVLKNRAYEVLTTGIKDTEPWRGITIKNIPGNSFMQDIKLEDVLPEKEKTSREKYHEIMEKIFNTEAEIDQTKTKLEELKQIRFDLKKEEVDLLYQIREESRKK